MDTPRRKTVLYVDHDAETRAAVQPLISEAGYVIHVCETAEEAAAISVALHFDLLIVDIDRPGDRRLGLLSQIRKHYPLKGIALSADGTTSDLDRTAAAGFDQHIVKPVSPAQLIGAIQQTLDGASAAL